MTLYAYNNITPEIGPGVFVAPTADLIGDVVIGQNSSIWFLSVLRGDLDKIRVGERTNIQDLTCCHADIGIPLTIGNKVTVGHRSMLHGCTIEDSCLIGMGAIVMNQAVIGTGSVVAAGTVILEKTIVPPYSLVTGSPGRVKKTYTNKKEIEKSIATMSESYVENRSGFTSDQLFYEIKNTSKEGSGHENS